MFTPDMQNPRSLDPADFPLRWNKISALAIAHTVMLDQGGEEDLITDDLHRFIDWLQSADPERIKKVLVEYFAESAHQGWDGHEDLSGNSLVPVYDLLARDIMILADDENF